MNRRLYGPRQGFSASPHLPLLPSSARLTVLKTPVRLRRIGRPYEQRWRRRSRGEWDRAAPAAGQRRPAQPISTATGIAAARRRHQGFQQRPGPGAGSHRRPGAEGPGVSGQPRPSGRRLRGAGTGGGHSPRFGSRPGMAGGAGRRWQPGPGLAALPRFHGARLSDRRNVRRRPDQGRPAHRRSGSACSRGDPAGAAGAGRGVGRA